MARVTPTQLLAGSLAVVLAGAGAAALAATLDGSGAAKVEATRAELDRWARRAEVHGLREGKPADDLDTLLAAHEAQPVDAWGHPLTLERRGGPRFAVVSLGADGAPGGTGLDADLEVLGGKALVR